VPNNAYYFMGVAEHELSEVMGRVSLVAVPAATTINPNPQAYISPLDLLRYTGSAPNGTVNFSSSAANNYYISLNGGMSSLVALNSLPGQDLGDFSGSTNPKDPYNAASSPGQLNNLTSSDLALMNALGYTLATVPLPASLWLFASACLGFCVSRKNLKVKPAGVVIHA
jgi:hypothetical protein